MEAPSEEPSTEGTASEGTTVSPTETTTEDDEMDDAGALTAVSLEDTQDTIRAATRSFHPATKAPGQAQRTMPALGVTTRSSKVTKATPSGQRPGRAAGKIRERLANETDLETTNSSDTNE